MSRAGFVVGLLVLVQGAATRAGLMAGLLGLLMLSSSATAAPPLLGFDFENAIDGDPTAPASFSNADISGGVFGGSNAGSQVCCTNKYRSFGLFPAFAGGGFFNFFTFTTANRLQLTGLDFEASHNDTSIDIDRNFEVLLSPVNATAPMNGDQKDTLSAYTLLATVAVPDGGVNPLNIDLTGNNLTPGTYHIAWAVAAGAGIVTGTTQLFMDNIHLLGFVGLSDSDGDGVDDAIDVCHNTPSGTAVDAAGRPLGDVDQDCDTDLEDHALSQQGFTGPLALVIATVPVGNPGNANDTEGAGYGGVDYVYNIGKYEVTAGQYTGFLNAVAGVDTYGLYSTDMWSDGTETECKVERFDGSGTVGDPYQYRVASDWANRPVNYVSWGDAARFSNWLHNGQPTGAQDLTTTEDGSYFLNGAMSDAQLLVIEREPDATWVIPSEDEWYKAAYHKNDGETGNYFDYPTSTDSVPSNDLIDPDPGNNATFLDGGFTIGSPYYRTVFSAHENSHSPYGTFDQCGNVWEWNEAIHFGSSRGLRGGSFIENDNFLHAASRSRQVPTNESLVIGFRVAEVP